MLLTKLHIPQPKKNIVHRFGLFEKLNPGDLFPHHYHIHNYVSQKELSFHIKLHGNKSIREGHLIAAAIERNIYDRLFISTTIHVDPDTLDSNEGN